MMQSWNDMALLRAFVGDGSQAAFAALAARHVDRVYSTALRQTGNAHQAEEITQAVFVILAQKAETLARSGGGHASLAGWLYQTARLTAITHVRAEIRRTRREQEAYMQNLLNRDTPDDGSAAPPNEETWRQIAPLLDDALAGLRETDRHAVVLRYFYGRSLPEIGTALGRSEDSARMRINRALERMRKFFAKHGVTSTTTALTAVLAVNSVHAAPAGLAQTISAVAVTKGAAVSTTTLTLIKGALKLMAWTKAKTVIIISAAALLATGTATVAVKEIRQHIKPPIITDGIDDSYFAPKPPEKVFSLPTNIFILRPSHFDTEVGFTLSRVKQTKSRSGAVTNVNVTDYQVCVVLTGQTLRSLLDASYVISPIRIILPDDAPEGRFDCLLTLPAKSQLEQLQRIQDKISRQLKLVGHKETLTTNVLLLKVKNPQATGLRPHIIGSDYHVETKSGTIYIRGQDMKFLAFDVEHGLNQIVEDQTGLTGRYDYELDEKLFDGSGNPDEIKQVLLHQFGLELVPTNLPVEMLVVEKVK